METVELMTLLPPGLLGFASVIPILVGNNPFSEDPKVKPLLSTATVLMVWLVWLCASILFHLLLFSQYWALLALALALGCLGTLLYELIFPTALPATADEAALATAARRKKAALLYSGGLLCTAVAASILMAMKGWVVIDVQVAGLHGHTVREVSLRSMDSPLDLPVRQPRHVVLTCQNAVRMVITQHDFEDLKTWNYLCVILGDAKNSAYKGDYYLKKENLSEVVMPGAGSYMQGIMTTERPKKEATSGTDASKTSKSQQKPAHENSQ